MTRFTFEAIGTSWRIDIDAKLSSLQEAELLSSIKKRIDEFDKAYSRFRKDSLVTEMSQKSGTYELPDDAPAMLDLYKELYDLTEGKLTPLIGNVISDAGYDASYSLKQKKELETPPFWNEVLEYNHPKLTMKKPAILDFGAAGKGYLIDIVGEVIESKGISAYLIDAGGDIRHRGTEAIKVGLENPDDFKQVIGVFELKNGSICGSAGNRRRWDKFTHIIDPKTLNSPTEIVATWVAADSTLLADGLATALFFVEPEKLGKFRFEYVIIYSDRSFKASDSFKGSMFDA